MNILCIIQGELSDRNSDRRVRRKAMERAGEYSARQNFNRLFG